MTATHLLASQRLHLAGLLEAIQRDLYLTANRFIAYCELQLSVTPLSPDFTVEFKAIIQS